MRRFLLAAAAAALLAVVPAAAQCPVLDVKTSVRKTVNGGRHAQLTVRVTDRGLAVTDGGLMLMLPSGMTYSAVKVSPKLSPAPGGWTHGSRSAATRSIDLSPHLHHT